MLLRCGGRYYCVVVQYVARLHADKLAKVVRAWNDGAQKPAKT